MTAYLKPETARALLAMSRGYWQLRRCGFDRASAWETAAIAAGVNPNSAR